MIRVLLLIVIIIFISVFPREKSTEYDPNNCYVTNSGGVFRDILAKGGFLHGNKPIPGTREEKYALAEKTCMNVPADCEMTTIMTVDAQKTYWLRSKCFMKAAIDLRDEALCKQVKEKKHTFYDGSYFTEESCLKEIAVNREHDAFRDNVKQNIDSLTPHQPGKLEIIPEANGNLRIRVTSTGNVAGNYVTNVFIKSLVTIPKIRYTQLRPALQPLNAGAVTLEWVLEKERLERIGSPDGFVVDVSYPRLTSFDGIFYGDALGNKMQTKLTQEYRIQP